MFTIGQVAQQVGVNIQTLRYYERIKLLTPELRKQSGYRFYTGDAIKRVSFIKKAQDLGFSLDEIRELLTLSGASASGRQTVRRKASEKLSSIQEKIRELKKLESTLRKLIHDCKQGDVSGPCPILERMKGRP